MLEGDGFSLQLLSTMLWLTGRESKRSNLVCNFLNFSPQISILARSYTNVKVQLMLGKFDANSLFSVLLFFLPILNSILFMQLEFLPSHWPRWMQVWSFDLLITLFFDINLLSSPQDLCLLMPEDLL